jgi:acetylornithine aminotransferase
MTLAKALGNGVPIGACLARGEAAKQFKPGNHGSTYGGNPLVCKTALTVIEVLENEKLATRAAELGAYILAGFEKNLADVDGLWFTHQCHRRKSCTVTATSNHE